MIIISQDTRQLSIPGDDLVFGVEFDAGSERKYFQCSRYVGDKLDLASCFVRINFRNANGEMDSYLVDDVTVEGDNVTFSWVLSEKAVKFKGQLKFVVCAVGPSHKVEWHTTLGTGMVLEGLEPDSGVVEAGTADVVAQLITMVELQTTAVESTGAEWVQNVQNEGADQVAAVQTAAKTAETASVAEIAAKGANTLASIPEDYTALSAAVDALAPGIVCEAAGSAVVVSDASDKPLRGMRIFGRSTQDGTPTPEAPVEIKSVENPTVRVCGKNLLGGNALADSIVSKMNGAKDSATSTVNFYCTYAPQKILFNQFKPNTVYTFIFKGWNTYGDGSNLYVQYTDGTLDYLTFQESQTESTALLKTDPNKSILHFSGTYYSGMTYLRYDECGVFEGDINISEFEPYSGQTVEITHTLPGIPVTSGGNYTDSNGQQWICDEVDLERGVYVQRTASVVCDKLAIHDNDTLSATIALTGTASAPLIGENAGVGLCNVTNKYAYNRKDEAHIYIQNTAAWAFVPVGYDYTNNPPIVLAALSKPIETPLSETEIAAYRALHSNYPNTTVLNDGGAHMAVKYVADTKLYIDNKIAALTAQA